MALNIGKGKYLTYYNYTELEGIENVDFTSDIETGDITTIKGEKVTFEKSRSVEVVLTFVDTSIANLKKIVPGAWLANAALVTGQPAGNVVNNATGAIALGRAANSTTLQKPLQFVPETGPEEHTITMFDAVASLTDFVIEDQVVKATVTVRCEATGIQVLKGGVTLIS